MSIEKPVTNVVIIDYELGNLFSVEQACRNVALITTTTSDKKSVVEADAIILPGVGAFGDAMNNLKKLDLIEPIKDFTATGKPFMGVCLGMQLLFTESEEFGNYRGLNLIEGAIRKFPQINDSGERVKVPQIAWNQIYMPKNRNWQKSPLQDIKNKEYMYFVHSYFANPADPNNILSLTDYEGTLYCSTVLKDNIFAVQFHPEKSAERGIKIYMDWAKSINKELYQ